MNSELCKKCVQSKDSVLHTDSVCEICHQIEVIGNGPNSHFIEKTEKPSCCGECTYIRYTPDFMGNKAYCKASEYFVHDDRVIRMHNVRKNYLSKNTPSWCPLRN